MQSYVEFGLKWSFLIQCTVSDILKYSGAVSTKQNRLTCSKSEALWGPSRCPDSTVVSLS